MLIFLQYFCFFLALFRSQSFAAPARDSRTNSCAVAISISSQEKPPSFSNNAKVVYDLFNRGMDEEPLIVGYLALTHSELLKLMTEGTLNSNLGFRLHLTDQHPVSAKILDKYQEPSRAILDLSHDAQIQRATYDLHLRATSPRTSADHLDQEGSAYLYGGYILGMNKKALELLPRIHRRPARIQKVQELSLKHVVGIDPMAGINFEFLRTLGQANIP